jgi:transcriptional regulator with XRE-family HTH domain
MSQGLTIRDLAAKAKMSSQTIVSIEKGNGGRIQSFKKLASALGVEIMAIREYADVVRREPE